ncbi:MAG TPA: DNA-directed RNA polymerase subunit alpha [bacterium]|nr:DNA-directed RNA polymerase subunit alpha [bacterium]
MEMFLFPSKVEYMETDNPNVGKVILEPCYFGYGTTIGNSLRRVLLSSLPGAAVSAVKIDGVDHEFSGKDGVKEDVLEILLNLKRLRLKTFGDEPVRLTLEAKGKKIVTAKDIAKNSAVEIINKDLVIATLTDSKAELKMELIVDNGRGYVPKDQKKLENLEANAMVIDSIYSPVLNVGYKVDDVRVGQTTDYDKLIMTVETDGTITPKAAVEQATQILIDYLQPLLNNK